MIGSITPHLNISTFQFSEGAAQKSLPQKIWDAVVDFFTMIAKKIKEGAVAVWASIQTFMRVTPTPSKSKQSSPAIIAPNAPLQLKLDQYKNLPRSDIGFMQKSIELLRPVLQAKDQKITETLQQELGVVDLAGLQIPEERKPHQLKIFNEQLENSEAEVFTKVFMAVLRAYMFSDCNHTPSFLAHPERPGGRYAHVNYTDQVKNLRVLFQTLPADKKEIVFDEFDPTDIGKLDLPENGKKILQDISRISNALVQNNQRFVESFQGVHRVLYPQHYRH